MTEVVCAIIINEAGQVFAARRSEGKSFEGYWEFPGGKIEKGEQASEALKRELQEELGLDLPIGPSLHAVNWENKTGKFRLEAFICEHNLEGMQLQDHDASAWLNIEELLDLEMMIADLALLPHLDAYLQKRLK
jgi:8-oxo-dGTP diphosphatase